MRIKYYIVLVVALLADSVVGMDGIEYLKNNRNFDSVIATSTNLSLTFRSFGAGFYIVQGGDYEKSRWLELGEEFALIPNQETLLTEGRHFKLIFTPVLYKNQLRGFRIADITFGAVARNESGFRVNSLAYLALSDTPVDVGEEDVWIIMEDGEWKEVEAKQDTANMLPVEVPEAAPPNIAEVEPVINPIEEIASPLLEEEILIDPAADIAGEPAPLSPVVTDEAKPSRLWLYLGGIGIFLFCCAIAYVTKRKGAHTET